MIPNFDRFRYAALNSYYTLLLLLQTGADWLCVLLDASICSLVITLPCKIEADKYIDWSHHLVFRPSLHNIISP